MGYAICLIRECGKIAVTAVLTGVVSRHVKASSDDAEAVRSRFVLFEARPFIQARSHHLQMLYG